jgi:hypothetical protein
LSSNLFIFFAMTYLPSSFAPGLIPSFLFIHRRSRRQTTQTRENGVTPLGQARERGKGDLEGRAPRRRRRRRRIQAVVASAPRPRRVHTRLRQATTTALTICSSPPSRHRASRPPPREHARPRPPLLRIHARPGTRLQAR